jgi:Neuraminidase-like domain/Salmonella virulence plasmid 28.1kDa A protein
MASSGQGSGPSQPAQPLQPLIDPKPIINPLPIIIPPPIVIPPKTFTITGTLYQVNGASVPNVTIQAFDVDLRQQQLLGQAKTGTDGKYSISYTSAQIRRPGKSLADVRVTALGDTPNTTVAQSPIYFQTVDKTEIDLVVGGTDIIGKSEFDTLVDAITPSLDGINIGDLTTDDITYLAGETNVSQSHLQLLAQAYAMSKQTALEPRFIYGLFREGISTDPTELLRTRVALLEGGIAAAVDDNVIQATDAEVSDAMTKLQAAIVNSAAAASSAVTSKAGLVFKKVLANPAPIMDSLSKAANTEAFWTDLKTRPETKDLIPAIQFNMQLGVITLNHQPLIDAITAKQTSGEIKSFTDLAKYRASDWLQLIGDPSNIPAEIPGNTAADRAQTYATAIAQVVEDALPTEFVKNRLSDADDKMPFTGDSGKLDMITFLTSNPTFDLTTHRMADFVANNPTGLAGVTNKDQLFSNMATFQRLYSVAPKYNQVQPLIADGIHSAFQISRMGRTAFASKYGIALGSTRVAEQIYERSNYVHSSAFTLFANYGSGSAKPPMPVFINPGRYIHRHPPKGIPDWASLFGTIDSCSCSQCRALDSPAAYLVDLLHFLKDRQQGSTNAKNVLFERRPDIGEIELTCANTNTPLPYVDLSVEILENAISPPAPFTSYNLPSTAVALLDQQDAASLQTLFKPALSQYANITVEQKGERWKVNELGFSYTVTSTGLVTTVSNRTRQTAGTAQELAANPQYINMDAYGKLAQQVFPGNLPYNLPWNTVRTYLNHLGVNRFNLMKSFQGMSEEAALQDFNIAIEYLGISAASSDIITGKTTSQAGWPVLGAWNLWGFRKSTLDSVSAIADPSNRTALITTGLWTTVLTSRVDVFLQQSGIVYSDLLNILEVYPIFGLSVLPTINATTGNAVDTCQLDQLQINGLTDVSLGYIVRFIRLWKALNGWGVLDLARAIRVLTGSSSAFEVTNDFLVHLAQVDRLSHHLNLPVDTTLTFYSALETNVYIDHNVSELTSTVKSSYDNIFNNNTVDGQPHLKFTGSTTKLPGVLTDFAPAIIAALNISSSDLLLLLGNSNVITTTDVTVANLSILYRHACLANALNLSVSDYLSLFKFLSTTPFSTAFDTINFVLRAQKIINSGFTIEEMNYLLRYSFIPGSLVALDDTTIGTVLDSLRSQLQKITVDNTLNTASVDKNGDIVKSKLSLLSWDPQVITQITGILSNMSSFQVQLASRPQDDVIFPKATDPSHSISADIQGKIAYDPSSLILSFRGVMTVDEKTALLDPQAGLPAPVSSQIQSLFDAPRNFFTRYAQAFSIPDYSTPLTQLDPGISIPIKSKVFFDPLLGMLHSKGALSSSERDSLVSLATNLPAQQPFVDAVQKLYNMPVSFTPAANDTFLTTSDFSNLFDHATDSSSNAITPTSRFIYVLQKLLPYLLNTLSDQAVTQTLVENTGLDSQSTNFILDTASTSFLRRSTFRDPAFVSGSVSIRAIFPNLYRGYELLYKISMIVARLHISIKQLKWIMSYRLVAGDPTSGWLDLLSLPLQFVDDARSAFSTWERLYSLTLLRDAIPGVENTLDQIFAAARATGATIDSILKPLEDVKKYAADDLTFLTGANGLNFQIPNDFKDEVMLTRLLKCLQQTRVIGCSAQVAKSLAQTNIDFNSAQVTVQVTKSRYDQDTWNSIARPLRNLLRENQRAALVSYLLTNQAAAGQFWRDTNDLFSYFLIDVEMGPCQLTSRIKQAICSVQLFTQRCLMNLEQEVKADTGADPVWDEWSWMKYENVHAANYQILLNPENYMEPDLRDDQTDFFKAFTKELQQADITNDTASAAFANYLQSLDEISRLEVVSTFHELESLTGSGNPATDVLHVVARTRFDRPVYYYRRWVDSSYWEGGWSKISVDLEGDHIMPVVWNRKLFIFWITFQKKQESSDITMPDKGQKVEHNDPYLDITLAWSISDGNTFSGKKTSSNTFPWDSDIQYESALMLNCYVDKDGATLEVQLRTNRYIAYFVFSGINGEPTVQKVNAGAVVQEMTQQIRLASTAALRKQVLMPGKPVKKPPPRPNPKPSKPPKPKTPSQPTQPPPAQKPSRPKGPKLPTPPNTDIYNMSFLETDDSDGSVILMGPYGDQVVLKKTPPSKFNIVYTAQDPHLTLGLPIFFQHDQRSFFVVPQDFVEQFSTIRVRRLASAEQIDPTWMDGRIIGHYIDNLSPQVPKQNQPYPEPSQSGPSKFAQSIAWEQGESLSSLVDDGDQTTTQALMVKVSLPIHTSNFLKPSATIINQNRLPMTITSVSIHEWVFSLFYHPFVKQFSAALSADGIDGLLQRSTQLLGENNPTFVTTYDPNTVAVTTDATGMYAEEVVDFENGPYSVYNWELFFHIPLMIAVKLSTNQKFEDAQKWFHYIFDPTDTSSLDSPRRFWRTKKFFETTSTQYQEQTLPAIFDLLAARGDPAAAAKLTPGQQQVLKGMETSINEWRKNPFNPFLVARTRTTAFQKMVVMKYLDNLISWGDSLFRGNTIEKINEATQIYILASEILGRRPVEIPQRVKPTVQSFNSLEPKLDDVSNALVQIEEMVPPNRANPVFMRRHLPTPVRPTVLFFCLTENDQLLSYWDTVQDRQETAAF